MEFLKPGRGLAGRLPLDAGQRGIGSRREHRYLMRLVNSLLLEMLALL
jgi:hypothetical protein